MTSVYILANETPLMRANRLELEQKLAEYRRYQLTDEYKAGEVECGRKHEQHRREWLAFAATGWPISRNLVKALESDQ